MSAWKKKIFLCPFSKAILPRKLFLWFQTYVGRLFFFFLPTDGIYSLVTCGLLAIRTGTQFNSCEAHVDMKHSSGKTPSPYVTKSLKTVPLSATPKVTELQTALSFLRTPSFQISSFNPKA